MVYQDYELVATKRVGHGRSSSFPLAKAQFNAMGGLGTIFLTTMLGAAGSRFGLTQTSALMRPLVSAGGVTSIGKATVLTAGPSLIGFNMGVRSFGNPTEFWNLLWNAPTYRREFKAVRNEHYY